MQLCSCSFWTLMIHCCAFYRTCFCPFITIDLLVSGCSTLSWFLLHHLMPRSQPLMWWALSVSQQISWEWIENFQLQPRYCVGFLLDCHSYNFLNILWFWWEGGVYAYSNVSKTKKEEIIIFLNSLIKSFTCRELVWLFMMLVLIA